MKFFSEFLSGAFNGLIVVFPACCANSEYLRFSSSQNKSLDGLDILTLIFYSRLIKSGFLAIGNSNVSTHI
jgi:hypothetical protein